MPQTLNQVVSYGFSFEDAQFTYLISGTVTDADVGKAVAQDTTAANTVKLAGDNDVIFGRLELFEDRAVLGIKVATISRMFKAKLPKAANVIALGTSVSGSAVAGIVKQATAQDTNRNVVVEVGTDFVVVEKI